MSLDLGILILRLVIGGVFAGHGLQKLAGWFGGPGLQGFAAMLGKSGLRHARAWALVVALAETGGLLVAAGLLTSLAAAALVANMIVAVFLVHWKNGFWSMNGGFEFNLVLAAAAAVIGLSGGGRYALDRLLGDRFVDLAPALFVAALIVGLIGFGIEYWYSRRTPMTAAPSPA